MKMGPLAHHEGLSAAEPEPNIRNVSRKARKDRQSKISKHEIRNSKQIQMFEKQEIQNILDADSAFWIFRV
jgi:hypothetical protein